MKCINVLYVGANITEKLTRPSNNLGRADSLSTSKDILKDWLLPAMASQRNEYHVVVDRLFVDWAKEV